MVKTIFYTKKASDIDYHVIILFKTYFRGEYI